MQRNKPCGTIWGIVIGIDENGSEWLSEVLTPTRLSLCVGGKPGDIRVRDIGYSGAGRGAEGRRQRDGIGVYTRTE